ncbi:MAG: glycoside hydrolase family 44 protein [Limisphaerales bacterium]
MKPVFIESRGWRRAIVPLLLLLGLLGAPVAALGQTIATWNSADYGSSFTTPPQINATNFYNTAIWNIDILSPTPGVFETSHTLNYTNEASMTCSLGWEFDYGPLSNGTRGWSANFFNDNPGIITAVDGAVANLADETTLVSYLLVSATNIVNKGLLNAGANGEIVLSGANVNLSHGTGLQIIPIGASPTAVNTSTNFSPDTAIYDEYWLASGTNLTVTGSPWNGSALGNFFGYNVGEPCGVAGNVILGPTNVNLIDSISTNLGPYGVATTNYNPGNNTVTYSSVTIYTNVYHQAVFVYTGTNNGITGQTRFYSNNNGANGFIVTNGFDFVTVQLAAQSTNVVTAQAQTNCIYLLDEFANSTNQGLNVNESLNPAAACGSPTFRPTSFILSRTAPPEFASGFTNGKVPSKTFFYDPATYSNLVVNGACAVYSAEVDNVAAQVPPGASVTNLPGRVRIYAGNLNLNQAHIRAEGQLLIQASNLVSSANAELDCQNLSFNLGSTNGLLSVSNMVPLQVYRLQGTLTWYCTVWSNSVMVVVSNNWASNSVTGQWQLSPLTNFVYYNLSYTAVDASGLSSSIATITIQDLLLHSTNIVLADSTTLDNSFFLDGQSFTLLGDLTFSGNLQDWVYTNAPTLRYFTNDAFLDIPDSAHFGDDGPTNYLAFVNNGDIFAGAQTINSVYLQIDGVNYCFNSGFVGIAQTALLTGAYVISQSDQQFYANTLTITGDSYLSTDGALDFNITNSLSDNGAANSFDCYNGFNLWIKPQTGDLIGSTLTSYISGNSVVDHGWAGEDRGPSRTGFTNNVAIGTLVLSAENPSQGPIFHFYGTGPSSNAMYVLSLDLSQLTTSSAQVAKMIQIDPGMKIYVSQVILGFTPPGNQTPEDFLAALFPGQVITIPNPPVSVAIDAQANAHAISPMIYGVAFASSNELKDLNFTMNRSGGNAETRYNWLQNAHNHAADWYFESIPDEFGSGTPVASGATADAFVSNSKNGGSQPMVTIPMIGWMPNVGAVGSYRATTWSYSTNKYGPQTDSDIHNSPYNNPDAGNGISVTNDTPITWNNPNDANFPTNVNFQRGYVSHLIGNWGASTNGGVRYYLMDNEHSLWYATHQDVHPVGPTMQEIWTNMVIYASMVKSNDPNALVCGPEEWGWNGYLYSGYDQQWFNTTKDYNPADYPDRAANGGWDYMPWLLNNFQQYNTTNHQRLLDYFTLHCYPQVVNVSSQSAVDTATELLRNQSTRVFWDTNYVDPSWINNIIMLIPRMKNWVATYYPGTKIGVTEYNWGAEPYMNGATAQADILGIFGSQGLDLATRWTTPATNTPTYMAMKLYRNYNGNKSAFGDTSVAVTVPNPDSLSAFAAIRTNDNALTIMVVNKALTGVTPFSMNITNFAISATAQVWQLATTNGIHQLANVTPTNGILSALLPAQSVTLFVVPQGGVGSLQVTITPAGAVSAGAQWQVDGGALQNSGATVANLSEGIHTVSFSTVSGWITPASQTVTISMNHTSTISANYSPAGSLQVTLSPAGAVSSGALWQVDGGAFQNSGATVSNLSVGNHTLAFNTVNNWASPASQTVAIVAGQTTAATGTYVAVDGSLQVMLSPPNAITAGALWQVDGGAFQTNAAIVSGLSQGSHTVAYAAVSGFKTPANQAVTITAGFTSALTGVYVSTSTNKPALTITAPKAGQSVSNALFTVTGTTTGKVAVASVYYALNNSPWTNATTVNNWTNWSAAVTLTPGTNTIAAYAMDNNGNVSTTNKVGFVCVLSAKLSVSTNGLGSLSPNYNGTLLQIGNSFSITATAAKGFAFVNWTGGTNLPLGVITNKVTIQFLMRSNLMLQANFADVTKPTNTITSPVSGQHMPSALATILGTATDNWKVSNVWYQLNNGAWSQPATTNGWTNWTTTVKLAAGTNTIKAYALDLAGNYSTTSSVSVLSSNTFKLQLGFTLAQPLTSNGLAFNLQLSSGLNGHVEASTNFLTWTTFTNFTGTNTLLNFKDPAATNLNGRFYRAVIP